MQDYLNYLEHEVKKSPKTIEGYGYDLRQFKRFIGERTWAEVDDCTASSYLQSINQQGLKVNSVLRRIAAVKSMFRFFLKKGKVQSNPFDSLDLPKRPGRLPRFLTKREFEELIGFPGDSELDIRDRAILALFFEGGLRLAELTSINAEAVDLDGHEIYIIGKGDKERVVIFGDRTERLIRDYLQVRPVLTVKHQEERALFVNNNGHRLPPNGVQWVMRTRSLKVLDRVVYPHQLRHAFASDLVNSGVDMSIVSELMGHANVQTTKSIYAHIATSTLHRAYEQAHPRKNDTKLRIMNIFPVDIGNTA
jgi:site-specific recombinase XerD